MSDDIVAIVARLDPLQVEWLAGWQGVQGAAYNAVASSLCHMGLLNGPLDWRLNVRGLAVRDYIMKETEDDANG